MRQPNTDRLPMRLRNGIWQLRKQGKRKRLEISLGTGNKALATERAERIVAAFLADRFAAEWSQEVERAARRPNGWLYKHWNKTLRRRPGSTLDIDQLKDIARRCGGHCEVSGLTLVTDQKMHPYQPSLDRVDNTRGYTFDNVRMVCLIVNYCMNRWGESAFNRLALSMAQRYLKTIEQTAFNGSLAGLAKTGKNDISH